MDIKRLLPSLLIALAFFFIFQFMFSNKPAVVKSAFVIYTKMPAKPLAAEGGAAPTTVVLGDATAGSKDKVEVTISNQTAGIEKVRLNINDYAQTVKKKEPLTLFEAVPGLALPFATLGIHITLPGSVTELPFGQGLNKDSTAAEIAQANSTAILDSQYVWKVVNHDPKAMEVSMSMSFTYDMKPLVEVIKTIHVDPASYEVTVTHVVKNLTDMALKVQIDQLGPGDLPRDDPQTDEPAYKATKLMGGNYLDTDHMFSATHYDMEKYAAGTKEVGQFSDFKKEPFVWAASENRFFSVFVRPLPAEAGPATIKLRSGLVIPEAHHIASANVDVMKYGTKPLDTHGVLRLTGAVLELPGKGTVSSPLSVYMGPKKKEILDVGPGAAPGSQEYAYRANSYLSIIQFSQACILYMWCPLDSMALVVLKMLDWVKHTIGFNNYGVAIMVLVILVRFALHPLTRASQINMAKMGKKMRDVQPQIEAMKKRYPISPKTPNNKRKQSEETIRIYRENKVNPAGGILGCLPMLIQLPIWAALLSGLRMDIDLRHASFIPGWINDLSNPDTVLPSAVIVLGKPLFTFPLFGFEVYGLNPLPILLALVFFINMKVTMASQPKPADEQQAAAQKMSQYTIFLLPLFLYNAPSGSNLYMFASTMGGLVDTYFVRKALKKQGILPANAEALPTHERTVEESKEG